MLTRSAAIGRAGPTCSDQAFSPSTSSIHALSTSRLAAIDTPGRQTAAAAGLSAPQRASGQGVSAALAYNRGQNVVALVDLRAAVRTGIQAELNRRSPARARRSGRAELAFPNARGAVRPHAPNLQVRTKVPMPQRPGTWGLSSGVPTRQLPCVSTKPRTPGVTVCQQADCHSRASCMDHPACAGGQAAGSRAAARPRHGRVASWSGRATNETEGGRVRIDAAGCEVADVACSTVGRTRVRPS
jgi:hypothetical protein